MIQQWHRLSLRERYFLTGAILFLVAFLSYSLAWQPLQKKIWLAQKKREQYLQLVHQIDSDRPALKEWLGQKEKNAILPTGSLSKIVDQTANERDIEIIRMQAEEKTLQVWVDELSFKKLLSWLSDLQYLHGVQITYLDLVNTPASGIVRVQRLEFIRE